MRKVLVAGAIWLASVFGAHAQNTSPVVIELFTSQGCSSCPPADAFLHKLAKRDDVIALGWHVDIWDYIGWKDEFADADYTERQRDYARAAGARSIYTPQMIVGGVDHVIGHRPVETADLLMKHKAATSPVSLTVTRKGDKIDIKGSTTKPTSMVVQLVRYSPENDVSISRGENAGRKLSYANVVTAHEVVRRWNGNSPLDTSVTATGDDPVVILIQRTGHREILAAAQLN